MGKNQQKENNLLKCGCYKGSFCPTLRNNKLLTAEQTLISFNNAIYQRKPVAVEEFVGNECADRQVELHELYDNHWSDCYDDLQVLHAVSDESDPYAVQLVVALICYDTEKFEEFERHDVITLKKDETREWWYISSVSKMLISEENAHPILFPIFGNDPLMPGTKTFIDTYQWDEEEEHDVDYQISPDLPLAVCQEARPDFDKLPKIAQDFYLEAVKKWYEEDNRINVDIFFVELN